jgi:enamine deaminase RidA (YjgF/YER057c/UK114 family)
VSVERFGSGAPWEESFGYSRAVRAGDYVFVGGTTSIDEDGVVRGIGDAGAQVHHILDAIEAAIDRAGARLGQVVLTRMYIVDMSRSDEIGRAHGERFGAVMPVTSMVEVGALIDPRMLVEIEAMAYTGD